MSKQGTNGSEIHRIKEFTHYNREEFERMYKICKPLIRKLSKNVDSRRFNVSQDIIQSYFWDKFLYVYNKYQDIYTEDRLKATLITSLQIFKNKLLRNAYTKQAEFNQELTSLEELFDNSKEDKDDNQQEFDNIIENESGENKFSIMFHEYMREKLTPDEYLLFVTELDPPMFLKERMKEAHGKLSTLNLIEYFELPKTQRASDYISNMRTHIKNTIKEAKEYFSKR